MLSVKTTMMATFPPSMKLVTVLARWFSWLEHCPVPQKAEDSILVLGTYLGCRFDSGQGLYRRQPIYVSLILIFLSLSPRPPSLKSIIKKILKNKISSHFQKGKRLEKLCDSRKKKRC